MGRRLQHVQDTLRVALARVRDAAGHRQRAQVVERVRDLLVDGPRAVLELALDRERTVVALADAEDVDAAVLADDRLADLDLAVHLETAVAEPARQIGGDEARVLGAGHARGPASPIRFGWRTDGSWLGSRPSPNSRSRAADS